jgi:hypothetical protein
LSNHPARSAKFDQQDLKNAKILGMQVGGESHTALRKNTAWQEK